MRDPLRKFATRLVHTYKPFVKVYPRLLLRSQYTNFLTR